MKLDILTPEKKVFDGEVEAINVPTPLGFITVLPNHASLLSAVSKGKIKIKTQNQEKTIYSYGGVIEVFKNKTVLLLRRYEE
ncbi:MAG: hypothetical protein MCSN_4970 [Candidatus Microsyncoccus archaeolyticus]|nr:MAG: hypothetical protein MCSN_4970 [Candidatus Parcubacteria bacterium]